MRVKSPCSENISKLSKSDALKLNPKLPLLNIEEGLSMAPLDLLAKGLAYWIGIRKRLFVEFKLSQNSSVKDTVRKYHKQS